MSTSHSGATFTLAATLCLSAVARTGEAQVRAPRNTPTPAAPAVKSVAAIARGSGAAVKSVITTTGGQEVVLRVELTAPAPCIERCGGTTVNGAPSGYMRVRLSGDNASQFTLQQMSIGTGQTVGEINFLTAPVAAPVALTISAWTEGSAPQRTTLTVAPPVLTAFTMAKSEAASGESIKAVAHFSGPPASAGALRFQVQTTNGQVVRVPPTVTLEPNKTAAEFDVQTLGIDQDRNVHIVALYLDKTLHAPLTVHAAVLSKIENEHPCCDNPFRITISGAPPPQGAVIQLTSANPQRIVVPPTLTIAPGSVSVLHTAQSIPGNGDDRVRITATYKGVSKHWSVLSRKIVKPDLVLRDIVFRDQYGNVITAAADGQPISMCATVLAQRPGEMNPNLDAPPNVLRISYQSSTGTGTSAGRTTDHPITFVRDINRMYPPITICETLPGLTQGNHTDVTLSADFRSEVDESREGNNVERVKIARP
jgi:hypothetical protein